MTATGSKLRSLRSLDRELLELFDCVFSELPLLPLLLFTQLPLLPFTDDDDEDDDEEEDDDSAGVVGIDTVPVDVPGVNGVCGCIGVDGVFGAIHPIGVFGFCCELIGEFNDVFDGQWVLLLFPPPPLLLLLLRGERSMDDELDDETNDDAIDDSCADSDFSIAASGSRGLHPISLLFNRPFAVTDDDVDRSDEKSLSNDEDVTLDSDGVLIEPVFDGVIELCP